MLRVADCTGEVADHFAGKEGYMKSKTNRLVTRFIFVLISLITGACGSASQAGPNTKPANTSTPQPTITPTPLCSGEAAVPLPQGTLTLPGASAEIIWASEFVPWWVRTSPDGRVLAVTDGGDSIYELKPDGTLTVAFRCPGVQIETFAAASDGALWFATRDGGRLYRVDPDGTVKQLAQSGNRNLEAGLDGSVYAMENGLTRITPDGAIQNITQNVNGRKFAIGPYGEIVALTDGNILRVSDTGETTVIASGYGPEPWLAFSPDGLLYVTHWTKVDVIDLASGTVTTLPWTRDLQIGESGTFAPDGRLLLYHPNTNVYALDLVAETVNIYYQVVSNSWAMAANPGEGIYIAFGNNFENGQTTVYRVVDLKTLEAVVSVPYGRANSLVFDSGGTGYLAVGDTALGGAIFRFDPSARTSELYYQPRCFPSWLELDALTDLPWWNACGDFESLDTDGNRVTIPGVPGGENASLAITPAGEFYTVAFFHRDNPNLPYEHRLYRWDAAASLWQEVADLTQSDPGITLSTLVACPDGRIYTVEGLDASHVPSGYSSYNAVRRLEDDGTLTLVGYDFAYDGLAADCDRTTGQIVFTSGAGIFRLTLP